MSHNEEAAQHSGALLDTIEGTARTLHVGRSTVYELLKANEIELVKIGRASRVLVASTIAYVERLRRSRSRPHEASEQHEPAGERNLAPSDRRSNGRKGSGAAVTAIPRMPRERVRP